MNAFMLQGDLDNPKINAIYLMKGTIDGNICFLIYIFCQQWYVVYHYKTFCFVVPNCGLIYCYWLLLLDVPMLPPLPYAQNDNERMNDEDEEMDFQSVSISLISIYFTYQCPSPLSVSISLFTALIKFSCKINYFFLSQMFILFNFYAVF